MTSPMVDVVDGEFTEAPQRGLQVVPDGAIAAVGVLAIADLTDVEFDRRLASLEKGRDRTARIQKALMKQDVDYGTIPGTPKPTLLKPGAEKLCFAYGLVADFMPQRVLGDGVTAPNLAYQTRCNLHLGSLDGPIVAVGYGSANSWERKHRYRSGERVCPACGKSGSIIKGKAEYGGGWLCFTKKGGCGAKYGDKDQAILGQIVGEIENPDPWDLDTTLLKMAEKRAHVDATLRGTAASGLFTQDIEDAPDAGAAAPPEAAPQRRPQQAAPARQRPAQRPQASEPPPPTEEDIDALFRASLPPSSPADPETGEVIGTDSKPAPDNGLTPQQFIAMAKANNLGTGELIRTAKRLFPRAAALSDLTDDERGRLLDELVGEPTTSAG